MNQLQGAGQPQARLGGPSAKRQRTDSPHSKKPAPQRQPQQAQGKQQQQQRPGGAKAQPAPGAASKQQQKPQPQQRAKPQPQQQPPPRCGKGDERARRGEQQVVPRSSKTKFFEALAAGEEDPDLRSEEELRRLLGVTKVRPGAVLSGLELGPSRDLGMGGAAPAHCRAGRLLS